MATALAQGETQVDAGVRATGVSAGVGGAGEAWVCLRSWIESMWLGSYRKLGHP